MTRKAPQPRVMPRLTSAHDVMVYVRKYFKPDAWAVFEGVANATGSRASRWADAIAFSLWPSRGLDIHGVEIKVSRSDLLRELDNPHKAEAVAAYCDFWWIAVGTEQIVKPEELPRTWGLLAPDASKMGMRVVKPAVKMKAKALDRGFVAALLRRAAAIYDPDKIRKDLRQTIYQEIVEEAQTRALASHQREVDGLRTRITELTEIEADLRKQVSVISSLPATTQTLKRAVELLVMLRGWNGAHGRLDRLLRVIDQETETLGSVRRALGEVQGLLDELQPKEDRAS